MFRKGFRSGFLRAVDLTEVNLLVRLELKVENKAGFGLAHLRNTKALLRALSGSGDL